MERDSAELIDGRRFPANMGDRLDVESAWAIGQCKHVQVMSLAELSRLATEMHDAGAKAKKLGIVFAKVRRGAGYKAPKLVVLHEGQWSLVREMIRELRSLKEPKDAVPTH